MTRYGGLHQRARRALLAALVDGDPCPRCGLPMYRDQALDADHLDLPAVFDPDRAPDAMSHASCNRSAGALLQQALAGREPSVRAVRARRATPSRGEPIVTSRDW